MLEILHKSDPEQIVQISDRFDEMVAEAGLAEHSDFVDLDPTRGETLSAFARNFDLVVTGAHSDLAQEDHMSAHPDLIALRSGRPVLVVPNGYEADGLADNVLVAWDGKRSSARAVGDAMPVLETKAKVTLLTVGAEAAPDTDYMVRNLERHGINTELVVAPRAGSIAETVIEGAAKADAKLIVMGAFEHSKFAHDIMGGVTTDVIKTSPVPVFMSH